MEKKIEFKVGKEKLGGKLFVPSGNAPFPAVIFFHGSGGIGNTNFESAKMLSKQGILGFAFNYRGVGLSEGKFEEQTIQGAIADSEAAFDVFIKNSSVDKDKIGLFGGSLGGYVAAFLASKNPKSIILQAPAAYSDKILDIQRDENRDLNVGFEDSISYINISKYKGWLLVQKCEKDEVIPKGMVELYYDKATNAKKKKFYVIKGAKHWLGGQPKQKKESQENIIKWFKETL